MSNFEIKQDAFCRFTRLRGTTKTAEFMEILMDTYEKTLQTPTGYDLVDGFTTDEPVTDATSTVEPEVAHAPTSAKVKRAIRSTINKGTK